MNFQESARILVEANNLQGRVGLTGLPAHYLIHHAAELFLKAALLNRGCTEEELRRRPFGHDLEALLNELGNKGVVLSPESHKMVLNMSRQHNTHHFRYTALVDNGETTVLYPFESLFELLNELLLLTKLTR